MIKLIAPALVCSILFSCNSKKENSAKPDILAANVDSTVRPGDDFFLYANGGWIKRTPIPASESGWGIGNMVQEDIYYKLRKINEDASEEKAANESTSQKIGDFWKSAMDSAGIEKAGLTPLAADMNKIDAIKNTDDLIAESAELQSKGVDCLFSSYIAQDDKNSEMMAVKMDQGGLGLPNRDYYFNTDAQTVKVREAYKTYLLKTFTRIDSLHAQQDADEIFALETALAK